MPQYGPGHLAMAGVFYWTDCNRAKDAEGRGHRRRGLLLTHPSAADNGFTHAGGASARSEGMTPSDSVQRRTSGVSLRAEHGEDHRPACKLKIFRRASDQPRIVSQSVEACSRDYCCQPALFLKRKPAAVCGRGKNTRAIPETCASEPTGRSSSSRAMQKIFGGNSMRWVL
jgi:hypothetical protein